jgi:hypothetical protein
MDLTVDSRHIVVGLTSGVRVHAIYSVPDSVGPLWALGEVQRIRATERPCVSLFATHVLRDEILALEGALHTAGYEAREHVKGVNTPMARHFCRAQNSD